MGKKKVYTCKVCGKTYEGYRKSGTCSLECSLKMIKDNIERMKNPSSEEYRKRLEMGMEFKKQFKKRKGKWFYSWLEGVKGVIRGVRR
ncbi:MAG: hypothetical protein ABIM54_00880 [candidate division WOR-3 bacterium]